jgi:hypothetical protein
VQSGDGRASLVIPAGALTRPVDVKLTAVAPPALNAALAANSTYEITPFGTSFAQPARLTITYSATALPAGILMSGVSVLRITGDTPEPRTNVAVDSAQARVTADVSDAGTYAAGYHPTTPCTAAEFRQFDFWLGEWTLQPTTPLGEQTIARHPSGCFITEWYRQGPYRGSSVNTYNPADQRWYQTYVDNQGGRSVIVGSLTDGTMLLAHRDRPTEQRWGWRMLDSATVRFYQERSTNAGQSWNLASDQRYRRR